MVKWQERAQLLAVAGHMSIIEDGPKIQDDEDTEGEH
jgi:hypothetical protein